MKLKVKKWNSLLKNISILVKKKEASRRCNLNGHNQYSVIVSKKKSEWSRLKKKTP